MVAEIGVDMSRFATAAHLCSWARFAPGVKESAGKTKGRGSTGHGNPYLARVLGEAAVSAGKTDTFLGERYRRNCCGGLNFGYFYDASPIIAYDGEAAPGYTMYDFTPSTVPGCRAPHLWLRDCRSLYDALGSGFTLLRRDPSVGVDGLVAAAARGGVPLTVRDLDAEEAAALYPRTLVLVRPDQHVAWRGDAPPANPGALVDLIRGAGVSDIGSTAVSVDAR